MDVYEWVDIIYLPMRVVPWSLQLHLFMRWSCFLFCSNLSVTATQSAHNPTELPAITLLFHTMLNAASTVLYTTIPTKERN